MREFIHKINSNKMLKIFVCILIALPLWLLLSFLFPQEEVQDTQAEVIVSKEDVVEQTEETKPQIQTETVEIVENLNYTYQTISECVKVKTIGDVEFDEKYIEETLRKTIFTELIESGLLKNVSYEQTAKGLRIEKQSDIDGYIESGAIGGNVYAAVYKKVNKNVVFLIIIGINGGSSETSYVTDIRTALKMSNEYILQARNDAAEQAKEETQPTETTPQDTTNPTEDVVETTEVTETTEAVTEEITVQESN